MEVRDSLARAPWLSGGRQLQPVIGLRCSKDRWYLAPAKISRSAILKQDRRYYNNCTRELGLNLLRSVIYLVYRCLWNSVLSEDWDKNHSPLLEMPRWLDPSCRIRMNPPPYAIDAK